LLELHAGMIEISLLSIDASSRNYFIAMLANFGGN